MKSPIDMNEAELRSRFDFSKPTRGRFYERYQKGHTVTYLDHDPDEKKAVSAVRPDSQLTEIAGKHLLISRLISAGFEVAEPIRDKGIDLLVYGTSKDGERFVAYPIQMKASSSESFSLDKKYEHLHGLLITYVWNVQSAAESEIFALTFNEARSLLEEKGYAKTNAWVRDGYYFVKKVDIKLKEMLEPYRMTQERWQHRLRTA
jgi:hypothetical protein